MTSLMAFVMTFLSLFLSIFYISEHILIPIYITTKGMAITAFLTAFIFIGLSRLFDEIDRFRKKMDKTHHV